jgi:hypothetical protein
MRLLAYCLDLSEKGAVQESLYNLEKSLYNYETSLFVI